MYVTITEKVIAMSDSPRRRYRLIEAVLDDVRRSGEPVVPAGLRDEVDAEFGGLDGLLLAVAHRWHTAFVAHLDAVLEEGPADLSTAVAELWCSQAAVHATSRALLDAHADRPVLIEAADRQRRDVLATTGVDLALRRPATSRDRATTGHARLTEPRDRATTGPGPGRCRWQHRIRSRIRAAAAPARAEGGLR